MMRSYPDAASVGHYWKTGRSDPDSILDRIERMIRDAGGIVESRGYVQNAQMHGYALSFILGEEGFRAVWPVLPHEPGDEAPARRQAATFLYHDMKAKLVQAKVLGVRRALLPYLQQNGSGPTVAELMDETEDVARVARAFLPPADET